MQEYTPTPDFYDDYIAHYGVKGMKWGRRKKRNKNGKALARKIWKTKNQLQTLDNALKNAKTYEERSALINAMANVGTGGKYNFKNTPQGIVSPYSSSTISRKDLANLTPSWSGMEPFRKKSKKVSNKKR